MFPLFRMVIHTVVIMNRKPMPYSWSCHRVFLLPCTFLPCKKSFSILWQVGLPSLKAGKHTDLGLICVFYCVRCQVPMSLRIRSVETIKSHLHCYWWATCTLSCANCCNFSLNSGNILFSCVDVSLCFMFFDCQQLYFILHGKHIWLLFFKVHLQNYIQ